ncbi:hypothetical protein H5410_044514 [Solanum commersonii]|uniref:Uncharacterized protein n=1 Tax=Solanum commersonii TaxID=4109 RepID=A0A9J5XB49_SOLCO|nr:hypothetical protein H5410_044514 [Solanum commersonii]
MERFSWSSKVPELPNSKINLYQRCHLAVNEAGENYGRLECKVQQQPHCNHTSEVWEEQSHGYSIAPVFKFQIYIISPVGYSIGGYSMSVNIYREESRSKKHDNECAATTHNLSIFHRVFLLLVH